MKSKEIKEEIIIDYFAKERAGGNSILNKCLAWGIAIAYIAYTFFSIIAPLSEKQRSAENLCIFFTILFFMLGVPLAFLIALFPYEGIGKEIQAARRFLIEEGQEATSENINILVNKFYKESWVKIEDMLYDNRKAISAENMESISGNVDQNLKEARAKKLMIGGDR